MKFLKSSSQSLTTKSLQNVPEFDISNCALAISAGTRPAGEINPIAIQVMKEVGIDMSKQKSKIISEDMIRDATVRVNMGCMDKESCPTLFIHNLLEWGIEVRKEFSSGDWRYRKCQRQTFHYNRTLG